MSLRLALPLLLIAAAAPAFGFFATPAGYVLSEAPQTSGVSNIVWDPASGATDFYASNNGGIRRFDTTGGAFASTALFTAPSAIAPAAYAFFDAFAIDPNSPNDFYVSYSGQFSRMHKLTRTGPDAATQVTFADYSTNSEFIYRLEFVPDNANVPSALRGQLIAVAGISFSGVSNIYIVDRTTLALTKVIEVTTSQASGPIAVDDFGNIYAVVPTTYGTPTGVLLYKFSAAAVAAAITSTPVQPAQAEVLISAIDNEWNIGALTAREENGNTFLYYATVEHASIYRMCVQTGDSRLFLQGFGGTADGYPAHSAQGGSIAFSSDVDDFQPSGGGATTLAIPFGVSTVGFGSYRSIYFIDPETVNIAVASMVVTQQPTAVNSSVPFSVTVNALNSSGGPLLSNVGVVASAAGSGEISGFTVTSQPGNALVVDGLVYTSGTLPGTFTVTIELAGNPSVSVTTTSIQIVAAAETLAVATPPTDPSFSKFFGATLELRDGANQRVMQGADANRTIYVSKVSGPGTLWGQTSATATQGQAQFSALIVDSAGTYVLAFDSPGLPTRTFNLTVASASTPSSTDDSSDDGSSSCTAGVGGNGWLGLFACLALLGVASRFRGRRA